MVVRCPDCLNKYEISAETIPDDGIKVRCPRCKAVFPVTRPRETETETETVTAMNAIPVEGSVVDDVEETIRPPRPRRLVVDSAVARRMARAMLSELLLNRRPERDESLKNRTVLSRFGPAVASAFELYREKVSPDLPKSTRIFRDALNDILGEGRPIL